MTDNFENNHEPETHDEFTEPEVGLSEEGPRRGVGGNLAEAWRTRPLFKFTVLIIAIFAVGVAAVNFFSSSSSSNDPAHIARPPNLKEAPGGAESPYMRQQTEMANKQRSEQAIASGGSALPTPIGQSSSIGSFGAEEKKPDPLNELRAETEKLQKQVQQQQMLQQQMQHPPEQFDNTLAEAMQRQMQQLLDGWAPKGIKNVVVIKDDLTKDNVGKPTGAEQSPAAPIQPPKIVVNAGTVSYAQLLTEANSDVPGPILAQIVSGPLAGARAVGSFQVADGYEKYLVLKFSLADKKGTDYKISAIALDPDTTLGGMATEVDERYFARVVLPAAASFLQGIGQAMGQGNSSTTTNGITTLSTTAGNGFRQGMYNGLGEAAQTAGSFFQNQANLTKPLVRVAAGTPMGLFFVAPVEEPVAGGIQPQQQQGVGVGTNGMAPNAGYNNASYPGTTVNGFGANPQNANMGAPYPNYSMPGYGYGNNANRYPSMAGGYPGQYLPPAQGFGQ